MSEIKKIIVYLGLAALFIFAGCGKEKEAKEEKAKEEVHLEEVKFNEKQAEQIGLKTEKVSLKQFSGFLAMPAKVVTNQDNEAQVGSLVQGRVQKVNVRVGDNVRAGQILMYVEGLEIGELKAGYVTAKANLEFRKENFERQKVLIDQKAGSRKTFIEAQAEYEKAKAEFNAADKKIHSIGLSDDELLDEKKGHSDEHTAGTLAIKSPISGIVAERNVVIGQLVDGTTNAFRIINTSSVWIDGQVSEKDINRINQKTSAVFASSSFPEKEFQGKISYIGQVIDEKSRTITVRAEFNNSNNILKAQMFGELKVPVAQNFRTIQIPAESIVKVDNTDYVFVQKDALTFQKRAVKTGLAQNELIEIKEGLSEGETVVVKGAFYLKSELLKSELGEEE